MAYHRFVAALVVLLTTVTACASPFADDESDAVPSDTLDRRLAARPEVVDDAPNVSTTTAISDADPAERVVSPSPSRDEPRSSTTARADDEGDEDHEADENPPATFRVAGDQSDPTGDHGLEGPDTADAVRVTIEARDGTARVSVEFAAAVPERLGDEEVMGVGVDLYRPGNDDLGRSDYQVFADGGPDGWFAYLQTPEGFVPYPGRFILAGPRMIWELPWSSLGGLDAGAFRAFVDWSGPGVAVVKRVSQDWVPNSGRASFRR